VSNEQVPGKVRDRWSGGIRVASDGDEELVLGGAQTGLRGFLLAPVQEAAKRDAELEQLGELCICEGSAHDALSADRRRRRDGWLAEWRRLAASGDCTRAGGDARGR
jgi:hypothetical protein